MTAIVRAGAERLEEVEPLWRSLFDHHVAGAPQLAPFRSADESWVRRRRVYEHLLAGPDAFLFFAEREGRTVGYALARVRGAEATVATADRVGEVDSLAVLPAERGCGIGSALMRETCAALRTAGARELVLVVMVGNDGALRFYERLGLRPYLTTLIGPLPSDAEPL